MLRQDSAFVSSGLLIAKARAVWQWHNYYVLRKVPPGVSPIRINLDETSIKLFQGEGRGTILVDKSRPRPRRRVPHAKRRCCLTHVAFICQSEAPAVLLRAAWLRDCSFKPLPRPETSHGASRHGVALLAPCFEFVTAPISSRICHRFSSATKQPSRRARWQR